VPVLIILVGVAVLVGVFFVATGRGGELAYEQADHAPLDLGPVSATDVALLRPPTALWGYNMQVTDEALERIARAMRERDIRIAYLQQQLTDLTPETAPMPEIPGGPSEVPRGLSEVLPDAARGLPEGSLSVPEAARPHVPQHRRHADQDEPVSPAGEAEEPRP
jgi:hypothetical protein